MSTAPKGYSCNQKLDRLTADYASVVPVAPSQSAMSVSASLYVFNVADTGVAAGSTTSKIVITGVETVARKGDIIRFTSGAMDGYEGSVIEVGTDYVVLGEDLPSAPANLDTCTIFRFIHPVATSGGGVSAALSFTRNGISTAVTEDTVTPANNRPLPVKLTNVSGDLSITAQNLNVQSTHTGANPDSMQIGDGTTLVGVTAANEMKVAGPVTTAHNGATPSSVKIGDGTTLAGVTADNELKVSLENQKGMVQANPLIYHNYASVNVTTAAYVEIEDLVQTAVTKIQIFDSSGETMILALGGAGAETDLMYIFPGGIEHNVYIPVGQRLSIKAKSGNATSGYLAMNLWSY